MGEGQFLQMSAFAQRKFKGGEPSKVTCIYYKSQ